MVPLGNHWFLSDHLFSGLLNILQGNCGLFSKPQLPLAIVAILLSSMTTSETPKISLTALNTFNTLGACLYSAQRDTKPNVVWH